MKTDTRRPTVACWISLILCLALGACQSTVPSARAQDQQETALITNAELGYPVPATPYYHFKLKLDLPEASMIDVDAWVNGEKQRKVDIYNEQPRPDRPITLYRPAFADTYTVNSRVYDDPYLSGWLPWRPGEDYEVRVRIRLRAELAKSDEDIIIEETVGLTAPQTAEVFDTAWKDYKAVVLSEAAGIDREGEPVELVLAFYADQAQNLENSLRVVAVDPVTHGITEIPSQAYAVKQDVLAKDSGEVPDGATHPGVPIWVPTTTARVAFQADVPANTSRVYLIYHNNPGAPPPDYQTDLTAHGPHPGLMVNAEDQVVDKPHFIIENDKMEARLHPLSGVLDEVMLKSNPQHELFHHMETNGAIHWSPEAYPPPRPWAHMSDWKEPKFEAIEGPVVVQTQARGPMPYVPEVDASVTYRMYPGRPYMLTETSMRVNEPLAVQALRNGEVVFKRELITHVAWYDVVRGKARTHDLREMADLEELLMDKDVPWITFYNPETGIGFGGIQIDYANGGLQNRPRVLNPYHYVIVGPVVYWARAMNFTFASSASQLMTKPPVGSFFWEEWAFVLYEPAEGDAPYAPIPRWHKKLTNPLRVRLVEEVEPRVPQVGTEIYIDPSKTGWEERETAQ